MGLDISIQVDNPDDIYTNDYYNEEENNYFNLHSLSRTFCNFMCRRHVAEHEAELDQISRITGIDVTPIYDLDNYPDDENLEYELEMAESETERNEILKQAEIEKSKLTGNIDAVLKTVTTLIEKLNPVSNLPQLLLTTDLDTLNNTVYFSDFTKDMGQGYIDNNFGQDLRNFKRYLEFVKEKGTKTVWFSYN
jgi:hypothetical protein